MMEKTATFRYSGIAQILLIYNNNIIIIITHLRLYCICGIDRIYQELSAIDYYFYVNIQIK